MRRSGILLGTALVLLLGVGCTQVRFSRGQPLACHADRFRPGVDDCDDVMDVLGPPWMLTRTPAGFAFLYERIETLENQIGVSVDSGLNLVGFTDRMIAIPQLVARGSISIADLIRILYAWEKGDIETMALEFDHEGSLLAVGYIHEDLDLGSTIGVSLIISASPKVASENYKVGPEQLNWGMALLQWMPENLNRPQDLYLGQAGLTRVPAGLFVGQTVTVPRASESRREKKQARRGN